MPCCMLVITIGIGSSDAGSLEIFTFTADVKLSRDDPGSVGQCFIIARVGWGLLARLSFRLIESLPRSLAAKDSFPYATSSSHSGLSHPTLFTYVTRVAPLGPCCRAPSTHHRKAPKRFMVVSEPYHECVSVLRLLTSYNGCIVIVRKKGIIWGKFRSVTTCAARPCLISKSITSGSLPLLIRLWSVS